MAWVALDRGVRSVERYGLPGPADRWRAVRDKVHAEICEHGFNKSLNSFVQSYDTDLLDASLLMIPLVGFLPATDPRMKGTVAAIEKHLLHDGFVRRYDTSKSDDGLPPGEGTFLACTFWYADNLALQGRMEKAKATFERLLGLCNEVGLLAEEYDPVGKRQLGNFPQAFSHVGLVSTAMNLSHGVRGPSEQRPHN
jgi:GH15 family glucan-1,4-alpha-glucosidase